MTTIAQPSAAGRTRGVLLVACSGVLFSTLGIGVRLMEHASAYQIVFYRGLFQAAVVAALVLHRSGGQLRVPFARMGWPGLVAAFALAVAYNGMVVALTLSSVARVVFILSTAPLLAGLLAFVVLGERMRLVTFVAIALALGGIALMHLGGGSGGRLLGTVAAVAAVCGYAVFTVALRKARDHDMMPTIALSGLLSALISCVAIDGFAVSARDLVLCFYLGGIALTAGLLLFTAGARYLTAAELPLVAMTEFVLAPGWVWLFLGETVPTTTVIGGGVMLAAVLLQGITGARDS